MLSAVLLCAFICACLLLLLRMRMRTKGHCPPMGNQLPIYPGAIPILGNTLLMLINYSDIWPLLLTICKTTTRQGGVSRINFGFKEYYLITDPEDALTVANSCLEKSSFYRFAECWLGHALPFAPAAKWKVHRKLINPSFSLPVIHGFMDIFNSQAYKLIGDLDTFAEKGPFDVLPLIQNITIRTACLTSFGTSNFHDEEIFGKYVKAMTEGMHTVVERIRYFWLHYDTIYKLSGVQRKRDKLVDTLCEISDGIIKKAASANEHNYRNIFDDEVMGPTSFLETFLRLRANNSLTHEEVRQELDSTIATAFETTAGQLVTTLILLGSHPGVQERLFEEIMRVVGPKRDIEKEDLPKLVYVEAVIKESLRILPPMPFIGRYIDRDVKLKNYTLSSAREAFIILYGICHSAAWGPDVEQFRPERWLEPDKLPHFANSLPGFSIGKRACIGKTYALIAQKTSLTNIVRRYKIQSDYSKLQLVFNLTMKPVEGHMISLTLRN